MQKEKKNNKSEIRNFPGFHIEVDKQNGNVAVSVSSVNSVLDVSQNAVILKLKGKRIRVYGEELSIAIYENHIAEICGKVKGIELV